jgi:hypothetical protein
MGTNGKSLRKHASSLSLCSGARSKAGTQGATSPSHFPRVWGQCFLGLWDSPSRRSALLWFIGGRARSVPAWDEFSLEHKQWCVIGVSMWGAHCNPIQVSQFICMLIYIDLHRGAPVLLHTNKCVCVSLAPHLISTCPVLFPLSFPIPCLCLSHSL